MKIRWIDEKTGQLGPEEEFAPGKQQYSAVEIIDMKNFMSDPERMRSASLFLQQALRDTAVKVSVSAG